MKITDTIISIPPYISTTWDNVQSLHMENSDIIFALKDGKSIRIPHLTSQVVEQIYSAHVHFLEAHTGLPSSPSQPLQKAPFSLEQILPFRLNVGSTDAMGQVLQHNPAFSGLQSMPEEAVDKISMLSKIIPADEIRAMAEPEINCNCMYCQIVRILKKTLEPKKENLPDHLAGGEDKISEEELRFEQWIVEPQQDNVYKVTNKLDPQEQYTVRLSDPIGCSCGKPNCEHIVAVLRS